MKLGLVFAAILLGGCAATTEHTSVVSDPVATTNPYSNFNLASQQGNTEMQRPGSLPEIGASMRIRKDEAFKAYQSNPTSANRRNYEQSLRAYNDYMRAHHQAVNTDVEPFDIRPDPVDIDAIDDNLDVDPK